MDEVSHENWFMILHNSGEIINEYNNSMIFNNSYKTLLLNEPFFSCIAYLNHDFVSGGVCIWMKYLRNCLYLPKV